MEDYKTIEIFGLGGELRFSTEINEGSVYRKTLMKEDYLLLKFSVEEPIPFQRGDYTEREYGGRFEIVDLVQPVLNQNTGGYDYELRMEAPYMKWKDKVLFYDRTKQKEKAWKLTAEPMEHLDRVLRNLRALGYQYNGKDYEASVGSVVEKSAKLISYDNTKIWDALTMIAQTWDCEWWVEDNQIHLGRCKHNQSYRFEIGKEITDMSRSDGGSNYATRIYAFGSTRNLPVNYRPLEEGVAVEGVVEKRLMLPSGIDCIDAWEGMNVEEAVEDVVIFDDVYPHRVDTISDLISIPQTETVETEEGNVVENWNVYRFRNSDPDFTFSKEYILDNQELRIVFQSGLMNGMDFGVAFNPLKEKEKNEVGEWIEAQVYEIIRNEDYGIMLPNDSYAPTNGDEYVLYGFDSNFVSSTIGEGGKKLSMIESAEEELLKKATEYLENSKKDPSVYTCKMNPVWLMEYGDDKEKELNIADLAIGDKVTLIHPVFFGEGRESRICGFEKSLDNIYEVTYTIGESAQYSRLGDLESKVDELTYKGQTYEGTGGGVYVIGKTDTTLPSDRNVFSATRTQLDFLSRKKDDFATGHITFEEGITVRSSSTAFMNRKVVSDALTEPEQDISILSQAVIEDTETAPLVVSKAIMEVTSTGSLDGATLGELDNVDTSFDTLANGKYAFEMRNGVLHPVNANSLAASSIVKLTFVSEGVMTVSHGNSAWLRYNFSSTVDEEETGAGTVVYTVNGKRVAVATIAQGENSFDTGAHLILGTNTVVVEVTDSYGTTRKLTYTIDAVSISISSTFDDSQVFQGAISYKYIPIGALEKTIHFILDGEEIGTTVTSVTNRQQTYTISAQSHGNHSLEVYITAEISGSVIESNRLYYELICLKEGNMTPVIASAFREEKVLQFDTLLIPYLVYNPASSIAGVTLSVNGEVVSTLEVDRTIQQWSYRVTQTGSLVLSIQCGNTSKEFRLEIEESEISSGAETQDLELYLTSMGRSNSETNREEWSFEDIAAQLTGFNYSTNGWIADDNGNVMLRVSGDARVEIPCLLFSKDLRINGKTIEFEFATSNVTDYDAVLASCWDNGKGIEITAQRAMFASTQTSVEVQFKEEERVRISFVVEESAENRLIYTYINGIISGVTQYPLNDSFAQVNPVGITIGSEHCTVDLYNIRVYNNNLNQYQVLNNYIADMDDIARKTQLFDRNQIFDAYGDIVYNLVVKRLPCLTFIGDMPNYKGDKKTIRVTYENQEDPSRSFTAENVQIDVQGTSSQYYPRKNYKTKLRSGLTLTESGVHQDKYQLREESLAVDTFCQKADFAESSGVHNTGLARIINDLLKSLGYLTPPQKKDEKVRTTVDGFPIAIFHKATEDAAPEFVGKYNFNNDKSTSGTFGFSGDAECWEFCNNTSGRVLFTESDYLRLDSEGKPDWLNDFESRYPDDDDLNAEYEAGKIPVRFKRLTDWIVSTVGDPERFRKECASYFDIDSLLAYYVITELFAMVDQRAKNMFFATWDGTLWYPIFYDNDTVFGINNEGDIAFGYNVEYHDRIGTQDVWNGESSELWKNVEEAYPDEIEALYRKLRVENLLSYEQVMEELNTRQSDLWCEAIYNADGQFKYIDPLIHGFYDYGTNEYVYTGAYLYALQGSRTEHRKWWLYNRFRYMDSKYNTGNYVSDYATMRLYTPTDWKGVAPDPDFSLIPYADQYLKVKFGSYGTSSVRAERGKVTVIQAPAGQTLNDTETIIYGASRLKSLGDLSGKYANTIDVSKAVRLEELIVGSPVEGYQNTNLKSLEIGNNKMLRRVNVMNCPELTQPLDVSGCENIEEVYAAGSGITGVVLASGGSLSVLQLPGTIRSLTIRNQPKLTEKGFCIEGVSLLSSLVLENTPIDTFGLLRRCLQYEKPILERVRLLNVWGTAGSTELLTQLAQMGGVDENGNDISNAVVTGVCNVPVVYRVDYDVLVQVFPELTINYEYMCIKFADPVVKQLMLSRWDTNGNGEIEEEEALLGGDLGLMFRGNHEIVSFDEFRHFVNVNYYHDGIFQDASSLRSICLPPCLKKDNEEERQREMGYIIRIMFLNCTSLEHVEIPDSYDVIQGSAFKNCISLRELKFPSGLKYIYTEAFTGSGLESVYLPDALETIDGTAFSEMPNLRFLRLGPNVTSLGINILRDSPNVETILLEAVTPPAHGYAALGTNAATIYVPDESLNIYKTHSSYSQYASRMKPLSEYKG